MRRPGQGKGKGGKVKKKKEGITEEKHLPENYSSKYQNVKELHIDPGDVHFSY